MKILARLISGCNRLEEIFLCLLLLAMIILACTQIFMRDFFAGGFHWADQLLRYMVLWSGLFGAAVATRHRKHIAIDLASHLLPDRLQRLLNIVINLFAAAVCAGLTYAAFIFVRNEASFEEASDLFGIPSWQIHLVFPLAFGIIALRFFGLAILDRKQLPEKPAAPDDPAPLNQ